MPGNYLNFPFDNELFMMMWQQAQDPVKTALLTSGAMVESAEIRSLIANGSNLYTIPFYDVLGGDEQNYDGKTDITDTEHSGKYQTGVVYGRAKSWMARDFVYDFNSGANPMASIVSQISKYWAKKRQARMIGILDGIFSVSDDSTPEWDDWQLHTLNIATSSESATEANKVDEASAADAMQQAAGDNSGIFSMAIMHSKVAANLAKLNLLQYRKYTDPSGIERQLNLADWNGLTVIIDDGVPVATNSSASSEKNYTTYLFGQGALLTAPAPVMHPVESGREAKKYGGYDYIINRFRETIHPNGFSFVADVSTNVSPTDTTLKAKTSWKLCGMNPKVLPMARIISNG